MSFELCKQKKYRIGLQAKTADQERNMSELMLFFSMLLRLILDDNKLNLCIKISYDSSDED